MGKYFNTQFPAENLLSRFIMQGLPPQGCPGTYRSGPKLPKARVELSPLVDRIKKACDQFALWDTKAIDSPHVSD
jgi:hypothetical protein